MILTALFLVALGLFFVWLPCFRFTGLRGIEFVFGFLIKCLAAALVIYLYSSVIDIDRRDADLFKYYDDGLLLYDVSQESMSDYLSLFWGLESEGLERYEDRMTFWNRTDVLYPVDDHRTMIKVHSVIRFFSFGEIGIHLLCFVFFSFVGLFFIYKGILQFKEPPMGMFLLICILPFSTTFWASGMLKEALVMVPIGFSFYGLATWFKQGRIPILGVVGLLLFMAIKPYVYFPFLVVLAFLIFYKWRKSTLQAFGLSMIGLFLGSQLLGQIWDDPIEMLMAKREAFIALGMEKQAGSMINIAHFDSIGTFILQLPAAIMRTYYRPFPWEAGSALEWAAAFENVLYAFLLCRAIMFKRFHLPSSIWVPIVLMLIGVGALVGSVTPVLGALVRYKAPLLPLMMILFYPQFEVLLIKLNKKWKAHSSGQYSS